MTTLVTRPEEHAPVDGGESRQPPRRRRVRRGWLITAVVALVALALGVVWVVHERTKATPFTLDDALHELHRQTGVPASGEVATKAADTGGATPTAPADHSEPVAPAPSAVATSAAAVGGTLPASGVYTYATKGGDRVSMLGAHHDYPAQSHAIVTHTGGCGWHLEQRVVQEHIDNYDWCSSAAGVQLLTLRHDMEFFSQHDGVEYRCAGGAPLVAASDAEGTTHHSTCSTANNDKLDMTVTITARGTRSIAGVTVPTISYHAEFIMNGKATGSAHWDGIVDATTGLRLFEHRVVSTDAHAVFGNVHYDEDVTFELLSLKPAS